MSSLMYHREGRGLDKILLHTTEKAIAQVIFIVMLSVASFYNSAWPFTFVYFLLHFQNKIQYNSMYTLLLRIENSGNRRDLLSGRKPFLDSVLARVAQIAVWLPAADTAVTLLSLWSQTVLTFADYCHCHVNVQWKYNWVTTKACRERNANSAARLSESVFLSGPPLSFHDWEPLQNKPVHPLEAWHGDHPCCLWPACGCGLVDGGWACC